MAVGNLRRNPHDNFDRGWSWVVLAGNFYTMLAFTMLLFSGNTLYVAFLEEFGESRAFTSWYGSLCGIMLYISGSLGSYLLPKIGARRVLFIASIFLTSSFIVVFLSRSLLLNILVYGLIGGMGYGFILTGCVAVNTKYFRKYLYKATIVTFIGGGIGSLLYGPLVELLLELYGWRGAALMFGAVALNIMVAASTVFPERPQRQPYEMPDRKALGPLITDAVKQKAVAEAPRLLTMNERLHDFNFWLLSLAGFLFGLSNFTLIVAYKDITIGCDLLTYFQVAMSFLGTGNTLGRVVLVLVPRDKVILCLSAGYFMGAITMALMGICLTFWAYYVVSCMLGVYIGSSFTLFPMTVGNIYGRAEMPITYGYILFSNGLGSAIGPPLTGYLRDVLGSYDIVLFLMGVTTAIGAVTVLGLHCRIQRRNRQGKLAPPC